MPTISLLEKLAVQPLLCDGAMGTQLIDAGLTTDTSGILWNVTNPAAIQTIHQNYINAGCDLIITNTFQGSSTALAMHNLADRTEELNKAAAQIARAAADSLNDTTYVLADLGPFGGFLEPLGDTTIEQLADIFTQQLSALHVGGADAALIETMSDPTEVATAIKAARSVAPWPIIATFTFNISGDNQFNTMMGTTVEQAMKSAIDAGADIVGSNCGTSLSLDNYLHLADQLTAAVPNTPVILQPNAGSPISVNGKLVHPATPEDMAQIVPKFLNSGIRIIGGCCGTTPTHLAAMSTALQQYK